MSTAYERHWFEAVASTEVCPLCRRAGQQVAHRDFGKGMGLKTEPYHTTLLCEECHRERTDGRSLSRDEKRADMDRSIVDTHGMLIEARRLVLVVKGRLVYP